MIVIMIIHDYEIIVLKYETPHQFINYNSLLAQGFPY